MSIHTEWLRHGEGEQYLAFTAVVDRAPAPMPAVIVLQEAAGVDGHIEDVTRRIAAAGYFAIAPDLFSRDGERPPEFTRERMAELLAFFNALPPGTLGDPAVRGAELARRSPDESARLSETVAKLFGGRTEPEQYLPQMQATAKYLREENPLTCGQKVAVMGFCMGGGLTAAYATRDPELAAAAIFYGRSPAAEHAGQIRCPVVGFYGATDPAVNGTVPPFADAMKAAGRRFESHFYEGAGHAFFNDTRTTYHAGAARDSFARMLELFRRELV